jgi:hypothetical protein
LDGAAFSQDPQSIAQFGNQQNAIGFRRVRLMAFGEAFNVVNYKI